MVSEADLHLMRSLWVMADYSHKGAMARIEEYNPQQRQNIMEAQAVLTKALEMIDRLEKKTTN